MTTITITDNKVEFISADKLAKMTIEIQGRYTSGLAWFQVRLYIRQEGDALWTDIARPTVTMNEIHSIYELATKEPGPVYLSGKHLSYIGFQSIIQALKGKYESS